MATVKWAAAPSEDDLDDAALYLDLLGTEGEWGNTGVTYAAKDLLRASGLACLPKDNAGVKKYLDRIKKGETISPVLLVRGKRSTNTSLTVAEGYHRISACYILDEKMPVSCHIA